MDTAFFMDVVKLILPALIVFLTVDSLLKRHFKNEEQKREADAKRSQTDQYLPIQMQAYERMMLYLERITPDNLIARVHEPGMTLNSFHYQILAHMQIEYEHNLSQKLYLSDTAWEAVKAAKNDLQAMYVGAFKQLPQNAGIADYAEAVQALINEIGVNPADAASVVVKQESIKLFL